MGRRHKIGSIRGSSIANSSASRVIHPEIGAWRCCDVNDGTWTYVAAGGSQASNEGTDANGMGFTFDASNDTATTGYWRGNANPASRYYKDVVGPDGPVLFSDSFTLECIMERTSGNSQDADGVAFGIAEQKVATSNGSAGGTGGGLNNDAFSHVGFGIYNRNNNNGVHYRVQTGNDQSTGDQTNGVKIYGNYTMAADNTDGDDNQQIRVGNVVILDSSNHLLDSKTQGVYTEEFSGTEQVRLFLAPSFYTGRSHSGDTPVSTWRVWYRIIKFPKGLSPSYNANGGNSLFGGIDLL